MPDDPIPNVEEVLPLLATLDSTEYEYVANRTRTLIEHLSKENHELEGQVSDRDAWCARLEDAVAELQTERDEVLKKNAVLRKWVDNLERNAEKFEHECDELRDALQWRDMEVELPLHHGAYLCLIRDYDELEPTVGYWEPKAGWYARDDIVHWLPIPPIQESEE